MENQYSTILVGMDDSDASKYALKRAAALAQAIHGKLVIANVVDVRSLHAHETLRFDYTEQVTEEVKNTLVGYKNYVNENYNVLEVAVELAFGSPPTEMSNTIPAKYDADLIIVGATGRGAAERVLIGSVAERVTRQAPCDVLVVRR